MNDLLYSTPWWLLATIMIVGITLLLSGNKRQRTDIRAAGVLVILIAIALAVLSHFVETDKEMASRETREVLTAIQDRNWPRMQSLLDPKASVVTIVGTIYKNRDDLIKGARATVDRYSLKSISVRSLDAKQDESGITINLDVFSVQEETLDRPLPSSWQFEWEKTGKHWRLYRIVCLKIGDQNAGQLRQLIDR